MTGQKAVLLRIKSGQHVLRVLQGRKQILIDAFTRLLGEAGGAGIALVLGALVAPLAGALGHLVSMAASLASERADDTPLRRQLADAVAVHRTTLVELRQLVEALYGTGAAAQLGFTGPTPEVAEALRLQSDIVLKVLESWTVPESRFPGLSVHPAEWRERLSDTAIALSKALEAVRADGIENENAVNEKDKAIAAFDPVFTRTASLLSVLLTFIGENDLARRVRPSPRRPGLTTEVEENPDAEPQVPSKESAA